MCQKRCCAYGCKAKSGPGPKFYKFPACKQRSKEWLQALNRLDILTDVNKYHEYKLMELYDICDAHFTKSDKENTDLVPILHVTSKGTCTEQSTGRSEEKATSTADFIISRLSRTPIDIIDIPPLPSVAIRVNYVPPGSNAAATYNQNQFHHSIHSAGLVKCAKNSIHKKCRRTATRNIGGMIPSPLMAIQGVPLVVPSQTIIKTTSTFMPPPELLAVEDNTLKDSVEIEPQIPTIAPVESNKKSLPTIAVKKLQTHFKDKITKVISTSSKDCPCGCNAPENAKALPVQDLQCDKANQLLETARLLLQGDNHDIRIIEATSQSNIPEIIKMKKVIPVQKLTHKAKPRHILRRRHLQDSRQSIESRERTSANTPEIQNVTQEINTKTPEIMVEADIKIEKPVIPNDIYSVINTPEIMVEADIKIEKPVVLDDIYSVINTPDIKNVTQEINTETPEIKGEADIKIEKPVVLDDIYSVISERERMQQIDSSMDGFDGRNMMYKITTNIPDSSVEQPTTSATKRRLDSKDVGKPVQKRKYIRKGKS